MEQLAAKYEYSQFIKVELGKLRFLWMPVILFHGHRKSQHVFSKIARKTASRRCSKKNNRDSNINVKKSKIKKSRNEQME